MSQDTDWVSRAQDLMYNQGGFSKVENDGDIESMLLACQQKAHSNPQILQTIRALEKEANRRHLKVIQTQIFGEMRRLDEVNSAQEQKRHKQTQHIAWLAFFASMIFGIAGLIKCAPESSTQKPQDSSPAKQLSIATNAPISNHALPRLVLPQATNMQESPTSTATDSRSIHVNTNTTVNTEHSIAPR